MKKLLLLTILFTGFLSAQIKVVDKESLDVEEIGKLNGIELTRLGDDYVFSYSDVKFRHVDNVKKFSFKDYDDALNNLYKIIMQGFEKLPDDSIMIELPDDIIWLEYTRVLGITSFRFSHAVKKNADIMGISIYMTKRQAERLFGRRK